MSLKNFRWDKVFPPLSKEKISKSVKKSVKETGIEIVIVLLVVLGIWIYRWVASNDMHSAEDLASDPSVSSMLDYLGVSLTPTPAAAGDPVHVSSVVPVGTPVPNTAEEVNVVVSPQVYSDALAVDVSSLEDYEYAVALNNNEPYFLDEEGFVFPDPTYPDSCVFEYYSSLDEYGRCGPALACLSSATMPAEDETRGDISNIYPSGWWQQSAPGVDGGYLYNRSHLIAWSLAGENDNPLNLITGTRQFNVDGMYDAAESAVLDYLRDNPGAHVLYRVTPVFQGDELVARGVVIEAFSIEDNGGLSFCFFVPNVQSGWIINYATGEAQPQ